MGRRFVAALGAVALVVVGLAVLPSTSSALPYEPNCVDESNGQPDAEEAASSLRVCEAIDITKEVTGDAAGRSFPITVECQPTDIELTTPTNDLPAADFPPYGAHTWNVADGETLRLLVAKGSSCEISEVPPEGCTLTSIDPDTVDTGPLMTQTGTAGTEVDVPTTPPLTVHTVTVTNDCPAEAAAADAAPADVVAATPTFTG